MSDLAINSVSYTLDGASKATGIGVTNIKAAADRDELICHWMGTKRIFLATDLADWIESLPTEKPS